MKTNFQQNKLAPGLRVRSSNHQQKRGGKVRGNSTPGQAELFAVIWSRPTEGEFRLRAGDVIRLNGTLGRVIRVNECSAVVIINQQPRKFTTRFDRLVWFQAKPSTVRISPNSDVPVFNR